MVKKESTMLLVRSFSFFATIFALTEMHRRRDDSSRQNFIRERLARAFFKDQ